MQHLQQKAGLRSHAHNPARSWTWVVPQCSPETAAVVHTSRRASQAPRGTAISDVQRLQRLGSVRRFARRPRSPLGRVQHAAASPGCRGARASCCRRRPGAKGLQSKTLTTQADRSSKFQRYGGRAKGFLSLSGPQPSVHKSNISCTPWTSRAALGGSHGVSAGLLASSNWLLGPGFLARVSNQESFLCEAVRTAAFQRSLGRVSAPSRTNESLYRAPNGLTRPPLQ